MHTRRFCIIVLAIIICIAITSCSKSSNDEPSDVPVSVDNTSDSDNMRNTLLYFQDDSGYLIPVMHKIDWEEGIAKAALRCLVEKEDNLKFDDLGLRHIIPSNTTINGMSINDGLAKVNFSRNILNVSNALEEANMVQGIVLTLCDFPAINQVQLMIDGETLETLKYGTDVSKPLNKTDLNIEIGTDSSGAGSKVKVYFCSTSNSGRDYLVPVTRITSNSSTTLENSLKELLKGPKDDVNLSLNIPEGTEILNVQVNNNTAIIEFTKEFASLSETPEDEKLVLKSIILTVKEFPEIESIQIKVNGKEYKTYNELETPVFANNY